MDLNILLLFIVTSFAAIIMPGPSTLLGMRHGFLYGKVRSCWTALGITAASLMMGIISILGLGVIIVTSGVIFQIIKYVGAGYLIYLGVKTWISAVEVNREVQADTEVQSVHSLFLQGMLVCLSNPKVIFFFIALFPQFIDTKQPLLIQYFLLLITLGIIVFMCIMTYAFGGHILSPLLQRIKVRKLINKITGGIFVCFGAGLALSE